MEREDFYERTKRLCKEKGLTIEGLMVSCALTKDTFMKWRKRGTFPKADDLNKMCQLLRVSMDYLYAGEESSSSEAFDVFNYMKEYRSGELEDIRRELDKKTGTYGIKVG